MRVLSHGLALLFFCDDENFVLIFQAYYFLLSLNAMLFLGDCCCCGIMSASQCLQPVVRDGGSSFP
jgi:hypothetical protein